MYIDAMRTSSTMELDKMLGPQTRPLHPAFHVSSSAPNSSLAPLSAAPIAPAIFPILGAVRLCL